MKVIIPKNRHLQIEEIAAAPDNQKGFVLPDNYQAPKKEYDYYRVVGRADDCTINLESGDMIAVERHMVKNLKLHEQNYLLVLENYVLASLEEGE